MTIMSPLAAAAPAAATAWPVIPGLKGKTVAFVSNEHWLALKPIWKKMTEVLLTRYGVETIFKAPVPALQAAPADAIANVLARSQAAIVALAN